MLRADLAGSDWTTDARVRELRDRVRDRQWSSTGVGGSHERLGLRETRARLDDDTAILAYVFTRDELLCVVVTASASSIVELSLPRIEAALDGLRCALLVAQRTTQRDVGLLAGGVGGLDRLGRALGHRPGLGLGGGVVAAGTVEDAAGAAVGIVTPPELAAGVAAGWNIDS